MDELGLTKEEATWSYKVNKLDGSSRTLSLDGRIPTASVKDRAKRNAIQEWLSEAGERIDVERRIVSVLTGIVFEVRQGYKSKDSKRQNADIANAAMAYAKGYLPVTLLLSNQIDADVAARYEEQKWLILRGSIEGSSTLSTYVFCREVLGYDLAGFFERNSPIFKSEVESVLNVLLSP